MNEIVPPSNLSAHIFAAKAVFKDLEHFHLVEVPLKGETRKDLKDGMVRFSGIKFDTTSYNNDVIKFKVFLGPKISLNCLSQLQRRR